MWLSRKALISSFIGVTQPGDLEADFKPLDSDIFNKVVRRSDPFIIVASAGY